MGGRYAYQLLFCSSWLWGTCRLHRLTFLHFLRGVFCWRWINMFIVLPLVIRAVALQTSLSAVFCALSSKGIPLPKCPVAPSGKRLHSGKSLKRPSRSGSSRVDWRRCEPRHTAWRHWRKPSVKLKASLRSETFFYTVSGVFSVQSTALLCILLVCDSGNWYFFV